MTALWPIYRLLCWLGYPPRTKVRDVNSKELVALLWLIDRRAGVPMSEREVI